MVEKKTNGISIETVNDDGEKSKINLFGRANYAMLKSIMPEPGDDKFVGIHLHPLYSKLQEFVLHSLEPTVGKSKEQLN